MYTLDVNEIALSHGLGTASQPIVNTAILGAYGALTGGISKELVGKVIRENVPTRPKENCQAALEAFERALNNGS